MPITLKVLPNLMVDAHTDHYIGVSTSALRLNYRDSNVGPDVGLAGDTANFPNNFKGKWCR